MNYIIYDLEATCWRGKPLGLVQEVIEIGAFKLDDYGDVVDSYNRFIKPTVNPYLSPFCKELTSIQQEDIDRAKTFPKVIEHFVDWIDIYDDDYVLCSWGSFDKRIFIDNCELHRLEYDWVERHINLKSQYQTIKRIHRACGMKAALKREGFEFTGTQHRGIDDAENLAKIFVKLLDEWVVAF